LERHEAVAVGHEQIEQHGANVFRAHAVETVRKVLHVCEGERMTVRLSECLADDLSDPAVVLDEQEVMRSVVEPHGSYSNTFTGGCLFCSAQNPSWRRPHGTKAVAPRP